MAKTRCARPGLSPPAACCMHLVSFTRPLQATFPPPMAVSPFPIAWLWHVLMPAVVSLSTHVVDGPSPPTKWRECDWHRPDP